MLLACLYIAERGIENVALLSAQRSQWADPYFPNLKIRITKAFDENVGVDILHQLKEATATVTGTVQSAHRSLMNLKAEIEVGFKANPVRKDTLFTQLGLNKLSTHTNSQESYVTVLTILKANLTPTVKAELVQAGASASNIDTLLAQATLLIEANNVQENLKTNRKTGNKANLDALNAEQQLYSTRRDLAQTRYDYLLAWTKLHFYAGTLGAQDLARQLVVQQERVGADLIVLGHRRRGLLTETLRGAVARRLLQGVRCDVLVVPHDGASQPQERRQAVAAPGWG